MILDKIYEDEIFVFLLIKFVLLSSNKTLYFLEYQRLDIGYTNELCKSAGYIDFHSIYHLEILKTSEKMFLYFGVINYNHYL